MKLNYLEEENQKRRTLARIYEEILSTAELVLPKTAPFATHVYHQYVIRSRHRNPLRKFLFDQGIGTLVHYPVPIHRQMAYQGRVRCVDKLHNTDVAVEEILSLPMYPELSPDSAKTIAEATAAMKT